MEEFVVLSRQKEVAPCFGKNENSWFASKDEALEYVKSQHPWAKDVQLENTGNSGVWNVTFQDFVGRKKIDTIFKDNKIGMFFPQIQ